ncbi:MAG: helix-turn-helix transcriptional regulator [Symploca sp. SIO2G7]|nr:helix-turn-helix transcriptional regulator [Symploca sp. SIO2G7]
MTIERFSISFLNNGAIIRQIRESRGLSRDEAIRRNPYWNYQVWAKLEQGRRQLAVNEIQEVAFALGISNKELLQKLGIIQNND